MTLARGATAACPGGAGHVEVRDSYADTNGSAWTLCEAADANAAPFVITSYLNTLQLWQRGLDAGVTLNATIQPIRGRALGLLREGRRSPMRHRR